MFGLAKENARENAEEPGASRPGSPARAVPTGPAALLPFAVPVRFLDDSGRITPEHEGYDLPHPESLLEIYRKMVLGRRLDSQASALTKQGRLAVYPSSHGQEACQAAAALVLHPEDWLFPTYRDTMAILLRGVEPAEAFALLRGTEHCGYDPIAWRIAPQCTPVATHALHGVGVAEAARRRDEESVTLVLLGDGATSEGDFHEACNFAGVFGSPVVFLIQNNRYAISVPLERQTAAPALAYRGIGYGIRGEQVDGNDPVAMLAVLTTAIERARAGGGPTLVEAHTYRIEAHTNADDATRYRSSGEELAWSERDPVKRLEAYLRARGILGAATIEAIHEQAEALAADLRRTLGADENPRPASLFDHVYTVTPDHLARQAQWLADELRRATSAGASETETGTTNRVEGGQQ